MSTRVAGTDSLSPSDASRSNVTGTYHYVSRFPTIGYVDKYMKNSIPIPTYLLPTYIKKVVVKSL